MKFLRTIRFDPSDSFVFDKAAEPEEWAIPGGFAFAALTEDELSGKNKQAFSNGFLSLDSFGRSTFASVASVSEAQVKTLIQRLAQHLVDGYGAPSLEEAMPAAQEEIQFTLDLCHDGPINTVFALRRSFDASGEIREEFRMVGRPGEKMHTRIWDVVED